MNPLDDGRWGFVLSGGGSLGPLQLGAMVRFLELNPLCDPDVIVGTSAGLMNGIILSQIGRRSTIPRIAKRVYSKLDENDVARNDSLVAELEERGLEMWRGIASARRNIFYCSIMGALMCNTATCMPVDVHVMDTSWVDDLRQRFFNFNLMIESGRLLYANVTVPATYTINTEPKSCMVCNIDYDMEGDNVMGTSVNPFFVDFAIASASVFPLLPMRNICVQYLDKDTKMRMEATFQACDGGYTHMIPPFPPALHAKDGSVCKKTIVLFVVSHSPEMIKDPKHHRLKNVLDMVFNCVEETINASDFSTYRDLAAAGTTVKVIDLVPEIVAKHLHGVPVPSIPSMTPEDVLTLYRAGYDACDELLTRKQTGFPQIQETLFNVKKIVESMRGVRKVEEAKRVEEGKKSPPVNAAVPETVMMGKLVDTRTGAPSVAQTMFPRKSVGTAFAAQPRFQMSFK